MKTFTVTTRLTGDTLADLHTLRSAIHLQFYTNRPTIFTLGQHRVGPGHKEPGWEPEPSPTTLIASHTFTHTHMPLLWFIYYGSLKIIVGATPFSSLIDHAPINVQFSLINFNVLENISPDPSQSCHETVNIFIRTKTGCEHVLYAVY